MAIGLCTASERVEFILQQFGDGAAAAVADLDFVDGADRSDFDGSAGEKYFVGYVEHFAGNHLFRDGDTQVSADFHHGVARDARKYAVRKRRRKHLAARNDKYVFARTFADIAVHVEGYAFRVAIGHGFEANELRVHVIRGGFRHLRKRIGRGAVPGADANVHAVLDGFIAEITAPVPASHVNFYRAAVWIDAGFAIAAQNDGANIGRVHFVGANQVNRGLASLFDRE